MEVEEQQQQTLNEKFQFCNLPSRDCFSMVIFKLTRVFSSTLNDTLYPTSIKSNQIFFIAILQLYT